MSASRIILASLPPLCKKYQNWWIFDKVLTKTNFHSFLRHGVCTTSNLCVCVFCFFVFLNSGFYLILNC